MPERRTHSYVRHGTTSLFAALDVASEQMTQIVDAIEFEYLRMKTLDGDDK